MDVKNFKNVKPETRTLASGWIRKNYSWAMIPIHIMAVIVLFYYEECRFDQGKGNIDWWDFRNDGRTVTNIGCDFGDIYLDYLVSSMSTFSGHWRFRINDCWAGNIEFRLKCIRGRLTDTYASAFRGLAFGDTVDVYLKIGSDEKKVCFKKSNQRNPDQYCIYKNLDYGAMHYYKLAILFETIGDSVTLMDFKSGIALPKF